MRVNFNNTSFNSKYDYKILGKENKNIPYLFNHVSEAIKEKGVSGLFETGKDVISLSTECKQTATFLDNAFEKLGIKVTKTTK